MTQQKSFRSKKLILPQLQLRLIGSFVGLSALALMLQFLLLGYRLSSAASDLEGPGGELVAEIPGVMVQGLLFSFFVLLPVIFAFGVVMTNRVAGPAYHIEQHLCSIARGEKTGPCEIRQGDQLQSLCDAVNAATERLQQGNGEEAADETTSEPEGLRSVA